MKCYIAVDFNPKVSGQKTSYRPLLEGLKEVTKEEWEFCGPGIKDRALHSFERYVKYFTFAWSLFYKRKSIGKLVSLQQFYGLLFAFFCSVFHVKKTTIVVIISFIYKTKKGILGRAYEKMVKKIVNSDYIDKIYVHSKNEVGYYAKIFSLPRKNLFEYLPLGIVDIGIDIETERGKYVLAVGNSNRDFSFIENSLLGQNYEVRIFSDEYPKHINGNVICNKSIPGREYTDILAKCLCMIVALKDENISSGQLVMLQTYAMGKPLIVTRTSGCAEYVIRSVAIAIPKNKYALIDAIKQLQEDEVMYQDICRQARKMFLDTFTLTKMGRQIGKFFSANINDAFEKN